MERLKSFLELCSDLWCRYMHNGALWPMHGSYQCRECFRMRVVPWTDERTTATSVAAKQLGTSPDAMVVYQLLGLVYERQKKFHEAIALYEEFLRLFPDSSEATAVQSFIVQIRKQMAQQK